MNKDKEVEAYKSGNLTPEEQTKYEIAQELGILDKVLEGGWKSLSAKETGRIGGLVTRRKRQMAAEGKNENGKKQILQDSLRENIQTVLLKYIKIGYL